MRWWWRSAARGQDIQGLKNYPPDNEKPGHLIFEEGWSQAWELVKSADSGSSTRLGRSQGGRGSCISHKVPQELLFFYQSQGPLDWTICKACSS